VVVRVAARRHVAAARRPVRAERRADAARAAEPTTRATTRRRCAGVCRRRSAFRCVDRRRRCRCRQLERAAAVTRQNLAQSGDLI
jgi:hypothetical protein